MLHAQRENRMVRRFLERAKTRDPALEQDIFDLYQRDAKDSSITTALVDYENSRDTALEETRAMREYMAREGVQQYRDYFEDAPEEQSFFEYLDNLSNRDTIRFMECFKDWTIEGRRQLQGGGYTLIPKREFNPEISAFSNLLLDLVDFRDRVRPIANDLAMHDSAQIYQRATA